MMMQGEGCSTYYGYVLHALHECKDAVANALFDNSDNIHDIYVIKLESEL
jgi:hypothetical protein